MTDDKLTIAVGDRLLFTADNREGVMEGYNWINSCPIVNRIEGEVVTVHQVGYPHLFAIRLVNARIMRRAYLAAHPESEATE